MKSFCIETRNLTKIADRKLVDNINFTAYSGEIHTIIGSNGEGKTVFAKLLSGVRSRTSGSILLDGQEIDIHDVVSAQKHGIYMVQQEQVMFPTLSVRDNIISGNEHIAGSSRIWAPSRKKVDRLCRRYLEMFGLDLNLDAPISELTTAEKRFIQLIRVLIRSPRVLILDEFAVCLNYAETELAFRILEELKQQMAIIFITHNYSVLLRYSDRVTIINDGTTVASFKREEFAGAPFREHVESMKLNFTYPSMRLAPGRELVHVDHFSNAYFRDADFSLHEGEIIGLAGLSSLERNSLVSAITGDARPISGSISFPGCQGKPMINVVGEDDTDMAVFTSQTIPFNITASNFGRTTTLGFTSNKKMRMYACHYLDRLNFRNVSPDTKTQHLSTGNKQKLIIARSLFNNSNIYIYNEPSKNLDALSRLELYNMLNALIMEKATVLLISSDFAELIGMCSRIILMKNGHQIANYSTNYLSVKALSNALE